MTQPYRYQDLSEYDWLQNEIIKHESEQAAALGKLLLDVFNPQSVVDVGCGPGIYLLPFKDAKRYVIGIDGAPGAGKSLAPFEFVLHDLRNPYFTPKYFDLAVCIEVAEHLQPEHAPTLVATVTRLAPLVFWSAARPGQGGEGHWNEKDVAYWEQLFRAEGFFLAQNATRRVHQTIDTDPVYDHCHWLRWNTAIFRRAELGDFENL